MIYGGNGKKASDALPSIQQVCVTEFRVMYGGTGKRVHALQFIQQVCVTRVQVMYGGTGKKVDTREV
jgi:hypothetical protein